MLVEIYVLSDRKLGCISEWQRVIDREGFALRLSDETNFAELSDLLPAVAGGEATGFECDHWHSNDLVGTYDAIDFGHDWRHVLAFRFGRFSELTATWMAASA
jgi:hypothetical protein